MVVDDPTDRLDLRLPAVPESIPRIRHAVVGFAERHGFDDTAAVGLAVTEAATNAVVHAYVDGPPGEVRIVAGAEPDRLMVAVRDWGTGMAPRLHTPGLGLGLPTIAALVGMLEVEPAGASGTLLRMQFPRDRSAEAA